VSRGGMLTSAHNARSPHTRVALVKQGDVSDSPAAEPRAGGVATKRPSRRPRDALDELPQVQSGDSLHLESR
jgi:hypothetical protein